MKNKNEKVLKDFIKYCEAHPEQRFWQALRNWSGFIKIHVFTKDSTLGWDTFYFEGKDK